MGGSLAAHPNIDPGDLPPGLLEELTRQGMPLFVSKPLV